MIVDVGCGKGRVINWLLMRHPANRIVGIELDPGGVRRDGEAAAPPRPRDDPLRRRARAAAADGTIFFLFNPFDESVTRRFADAFLALGPEGRRIVYYNDEYVDVFRDDPRFDVREVVGLVHFFEFMELVFFVVEHEVVILDHELGRLEIQEFDFSAFADAAGAIGALSVNE